MTQSNKQVQFKALRSGADGKTPKQRFVFSVYPKTKHLIIFSRQDKSAVKSAKRDAIVEK